VLSEWNLPRFCDRVLLARCSIRAAARPQRSIGIEISSDATRGRDFILESGSEQIHLTDT
jgi:hypothetical protein